MLNDAEIARMKALVRRRHIHFDVEPELIYRKRERVKVGFQVRLWAVHDKAARAFPGCRKCIELADGLRRIAESVLPTPEGETRVAIEPFDPSLYESRAFPDRDQVALGIRIVHRERYDQPTDAGEEKCLKDLVSRLRQLGIAER